MAYNFTGRIKKIGIDGASNFCEFSAENSIKIEGENHYVAFNEFHELKIIEPFKNIAPNIFNLLLSSQNEKMEVEFECSLPGCNPQIDTEAKTQEAQSSLSAAILKVTIIK